MNFPDKVTVIVRDRQTGLPVEQLAVRMELLAAHKNNYSVGPFVTDEKGQVVFTRAACEFAIKRAKEMFLMDYHSNLKECRSFVEVSLHLPERVEGMIRQYKDAPQFWGLGFDDPERTIAALQRVKNADYAPALVRASENEILSQPLLELLVSTKDSSSYIS
jgi:hypothetical protein